MPAYNTTETLQKSRPFSKIKSILFKWLFFDFSIVIVICEDLKSKTPRIFIPWCFAVRPAYSVVIILPLILQTLAAVFLFAYIYQFRQQ